MKALGKIGGVLSAAVLVVCAGCGSTVPVGLRGGVMSEFAANRARPALLYIANYFDGVVNIYSLPKLTNLGQISGLTHPEGIAADSAGNVYVVDQGPNAVLVFHRGANKPFKTLSDVNGIAFQVAVGTDGTVYLTNEFDLQLGNGNVNEYAHGSTKPTMTLHDPNFNTVEGVGLDSKNNLYVTYDDNNVVGHVKEYAPGSKVGHVLLPMVKAAGGIAFDDADDLVMCDQTAPAVKVFAQRSGTVKKQFAHNQIDPFNLAFTSNDRAVFVTDPRSGNTYEYAFPSGTLRNTIVSTAGVTGVTTGI